MRWESKEKGIFKSENIKMGLAVTNVGNFCNPKANWENNTAKYFSPASLGKDWWQILFLFIKQKVEKIIANGVLPSVITVNQ